MIGKRKYIFVITVLLQALVLVFMVAKQEVLLKTGTKIILKCIPIDPRSLFSGDYVVLNYEISQINYVVKMENDDDLISKLSKNDTVFVALKKNLDDDFYVFVDIAKSVDAFKKDYDIFLKGKVSRIFSEHQFLGDNNWQKTYSINILYGIEDYFIPQNEGKEIEKQMANASVQISVADDGRCALSALYISGEEITFY